MFIFFQLRWNMIMFGSIMLQLMQFAKRDNSMVCSNNYLQLDKQNSTRIHNVHEHFQLLTIHK